jgi:hypothetical protein
VVKKLNNILGIICVLSLSLSKAQIDEFTYKRALIGEPALWNKIELVPSLYERIDLENPNFRLYGITAINDTVEAPYLLKSNQSNSILKKVSYEIINTSNTPDGSYFTLFTTEPELINKLILDFKEINFDYLIDLEGSQNQNQWFSILKNYRVLDIHNDETNFRYTHVNLPNSSYNYYRILVKSKKNVGLQKVSVLKIEEQVGDLQEYTVDLKPSTTNKRAQTTELEFEIASAAPVCQISVEIKEKYAFFRPLTIQYLVDSVETSKGWYYNYQNIDQVVLDSKASNTFEIRTIKAKKFKLIISNYDNTPLTLQNIKVFGYKYYLLSRITSPANYLLVYGNIEKSSPLYDLANAEQEIPDSLNVLTLGSEEITAKKPAPITEPLFKNALWLWVIMGVVMIILGIFSYKMLKK